MTYLAWVKLQSSGTVIIVRVVTNQPTNSIGEIHISDNNIPNIPDGFIPINNPLPTNFNPEIMQTFQPDFSYLDKQVQENLKHVIPFEERVKPITDRQDKEIKILEDQIDVYKVENQTLRLQLEQVNSRLKEESDRLKEETAKREEAETKLTKRDWKSIIISGFIALATGLIGAWFGYWLTLK